MKTSGGGPGLNAAARPANVLTASANLLEKQPIPQFSERSDAWGSMLEREEELLNSREVAVILT
jgi:hypothetical protein